MRIELSSLNALASDNTHTFKLRDDSSDYCLLSIPLTSITFPSNPEMEPNSQRLMARVWCGGTVPIIIVDSALTQKLYDAAIKAGFKQDKAKQSEVGFYDSLCLVAPFPLEDSAVKEVEVKIHQIDGNINQKAEQ
ncbi:hypothetical protein IHC87_17490 [Photobacterium damselae subsp. damselae]|uniref:hypothetical protein n=1 Tax=Photobacterium damselae TaxID=38293 RepID=UPI001F271398|nr:hypothetical protein [Photobacterium damselae]UJZ96361.1 hypothetical protein IHC87_17490 [Photobacterium damselae subsp. damselae]UJZ99734.1 hypothetical protein IHC88_20000 [Photobacterium damselae subsp. damselae]